MTADSLDRSPCLSCPHRDMDKNKCSMLCLRLAAYNSGESWEGKSLPYIGKDNKMKEIKEKGTNIERPTSNIKHRMKKDEKKREYHQTTIQSSSVKQERGLMNKVAGGKCLIDDCDIKDKLIRGLCPKHYQAWRKGLIKHPILGEFTVYQAKNQRSKIIPMKEKQLSKDSKASYYDAGGIETLDIIKAKLTPEQYKGYLLGCSLKYQCRLMHKFDDKDRIRDAEKAANYSLWLLEAFKS